MWKLEKTITIMIKSHIPCLFCKIGSVQYLWTDDPGFRIQIRSFLQKSKENTCKAFRLEESHSLPNLKNFQKSFKVLRTRRQNSAMLFQKFLTHLSRHTFTGSWLFRALLSPELKSFFCKHFNNWTPLTFLFLGCNYQIQLVVGNARNVWSQISRI